MNKGCVIALCVAGVIVIACCGAGLFFGKKYGNPMMLLLVEQSIAEYQELYPDREVETTNEAWYEALTAEDSQVQNKRQLEQIAPSGEFVDLQQTPIRLKEDPDGSISAISAGPDKEFGTEDDETSAKVRQFLEKAGSAE